MVIGIIGAGNMGSALARGLSSREGWSGQILVTDIRQENAVELAKDIGGEAVDTNVELARRSDLVVLCMKPSQLEEVASDINQASSQDRFTVVSILGATTLKELGHELSEGTQIVRLMPNIAVESKRGFIAFCDSPELDQQVKENVIDQFRGLGDVFEVAEESIDAITAVGSCSPAFFSKAAEAIAEAGVEQGLDPDLSRKLVSTAVAGTGELLESSGGDAASIISRVASPGGSTEVGLRVLEQRNVSGAFKEAVDSAVDKCREGK